jgi:hypothetical protein
LSVQNSKQQPAAPKHFVMLKLDNPRDKSKQSDKEIKQYETLSKQFGVSGVPTVMLAGVGESSHARGHAQELLTRQLRGDRTAHQARATAEHGHGLLARRIVLEQPLLCAPALVPQLLQLPRVDAMSGRIELLLEQPRERQTP